MNRLFVILFLSALVGFFSVAQSADRITRVGEKKAIDCEIKRMTPDTVIIDRNGMEDAISVGSIENIRFEGEPAEFNVARMNIQNGENEDARTLLSKVKEANLSRDLLKAERDFLLAYSNARIALTGGDVSLAKAAANLDRFLKTYSKNFRVYEVELLLGNMNLQMNKYDEALKHFGVLTKAKDSPILRARGLLGGGQVLIAKKNGKEGEKVFNEVKTLVDEGELKEVEAEMQLKYQLGLARCYALQGDFDKAVKTATAVIEKASAEDNVTNANAYNTLGVALMMQPGKAKDAIIAFLHTDLMYSSDAVLHREALENMISLWRKLGNDVRARELEARQQQLYR